MVNEGIRNTLTSDEKRNNFFFFNDGITMVCSKFSANFLQENNWSVKIEKIQIINGGQTCKTIYQTIHEQPGIDFSNVDVLVRLYEVSADENVIQDIPYATNSQNPVDFRDLKSNSTEQILLEFGAKELGYVYKRKKEARTSEQRSLEIISSSVAAESVLAVWRESPHLAKNKKNEFFSTYYEKIFVDLNAAQMIIAVLIYRFCDNNRRKQSDNAEVQSHRAYSPYFMSMLVGRQLLLESNISLQHLTHKNFEEIKNSLRLNKSPCKWE